MDNDEERVMHSKSDNLEIMINDEADKVTEELCDKQLEELFNNGFNNGPFWVRKWHILITLDQL